MDNGQVQPIPKRWWWRKRLGLLLAGFLLTVGVCHIFWDRHATNVLAEQTAAIRARGEPLEFHELQPPPVPPGENAALLYQDAAAAWENALASLAPASGQQHADKLFELVGEIPLEQALREKHRPEIAQIVTISQPARDLCRQARPLKRADWGVSFSGPALNVLLPQGPNRDLARLLALSTLHAHDTGNDAEAVETLRDILALGRAVGETPTLINALVEMACTSVTFEPIEEMLPTLKVGSAPAASREQVRVLIDELMDDRPAREPFARAMMAERSWQYDTFERARRGELGGPVGLVNQGWNVGTPSIPRQTASIQNKATLKLFDPMFKLDESRSLRDMTAFVEAGTAGDYRTCLRLQPAESDFPSGLRRYTRCLGWILTPAMGRVQVLHFRALAGRRMAAVALAIRLYEIDHGRRPGKLADLLPKYLDKLPPDPFRDDGATFGYLPDVERPMLYTVGPDGADDGGRYGFKDYGDDIDPDVLDWPFFLDGAPPTRPDGGNADDTGEDE